jgi:hypothetical protein
VLVRPRLDINSNTQPRAEVLCSEIPGKKRILLTSPHECELGGDFGGEFELLQVVKSEVRAG